MAFLLNNTSIASHLRSSSQVLDLLRRRQDEIGQVLVLLFYDISRSGSEDCGGAVVDWLLETVAIPVSWLGSSLLLMPLCAADTEGPPTLSSIDQFLQSVAFLGALLFFIGMKNSTMTSSKQNQRSQA
ncbi:hypothetical protein F2Q69_00001662 [Brassica cretica]|uniref:Uncharacterized protein n=1 Tax=Brassica cretica TaxID=69181 RepID=A0A8S9P8E6_BRACR|nr:hypothetical protein F2Q69_00001662 [Brassica cretica]